MLHIIAIIIIIGLFINYKKTILIFAPFKLLLLNGIMLTENISFQNLISLIIFSLFIFKYKKYVSHNDKIIPIIVPFCLMFITETLSVLISDSNLISIPLKFFRNYGFCIILFYLIKNIKDIKTLINSIVIFLVILMGNSIFEIIFDKNIVGDFIKEYSREDLFIAETNDYGYRGIRLRSFLPHPICFGNVCAIFIFLLSFIYYKFDKNKKYLIIILFLFWGILMANSRTPILALLIYSIPFILSKDFIKKNSKFIPLIILILIIFSFEYLIQMLDSMFNENSKYETGGSSMSMRLIQLATCFDVIKNNIFLGIGYKFDLSDYPTLLGGESIWFNILCIQGIFGCICYLSLFIGIIISSKKLVISKYIFYLSFGYFIQQSATYNAGLDDFIYFFIYIIIYKINDISLSKIIIKVNNDTNKAINISNYSNI